MKDSNNSDKVKGTPLASVVGRGKNLFERIRTKIVEGTAPVYYNLTHYQQLPINVILSRLQVQPLIEKHSRDHELHVPVYIFQNNRLALLRH